MSKYKVTLDEVSDGMGPWTVEIEADYVNMNNQWIEFRISSQPDTAASLVSAYAAHRVVAIEREVPVPA